MGNGTAWSTVMSMQLVLVVLLALQGGSYSLSRNRRYLGFPDKSNLVITITLLKPTAFMNGVNTLHEIDFPFPLPRNPHALLRRDTAATHSQGSWDRERLYAQIEAAIDMTGLSGAGCLERAMCEVQRLNQTQVKNSIVLQILSRIFTLEGVEFNTDDDCSRNCPVSIFHHSLLSAK